MLHNSGKGSKVPTAREVGQPPRRLTMIADRRILRLGRVSGPVVRAGFKPVGGRSASSVGSTPASSASSNIVYRDCRSGAWWSASRRGLARSHGPAWAPMKFERLWDDPHYP